VTIRFIPTCVGNMSDLDCLFPEHAVHPHVCGEHVRRIAETGTDTGGSSPRVWGTYYLARLGSKQLRFIPTCVGNMSQPPAPPPGYPVHPHVCGEHKSRRAAEMNSARFIPTCVGNMSASCNTPPLPAVHPHVCGEH